MDRITDRTNWRTIQLLLENGVFLLMGFEITTIVADAESSGRGLWFAVGLALLCTAVLVAVRIGFVVPLIAALRRRQQRVPERARRVDDLLESVTDRDQALHPRVEARLNRWRADAHFLSTQGLGWRAGPCWPGPGCAG
ncbi:hypothetical protein [Microbacterium sp. A93]|uniref:hypothetical protein n=1 Tax=Microbacterium sp. A93 TaxID=3450716 RepID=UPI003F4264C7